MRICVAPNVPAAATFPRCARLLLAAACVLALAASPAAAQDKPVIIHSATLDGQISPPATLSDAGRSDVPAYTATFNLTYGTGLANNQAAKDAFTRAAARWPAVLRTPVAINITVDYESLGTGILGQSNASMMVGSFDDVRGVLLSATTNGNALQKSLMPRLPTWSQWSAYLPSGFACDGQSWLTKANYRALGGDPTGSDGSITFTSNYAWDFDPRDGITAGKYDFEGVAMHEMGHILGFVSEEDYVDYVQGQNQTATDVWPRPLDYYRFKTSDITAAGFNFTTTSRDLTPGGAQSLYLGDGSAAMSTGAYKGDGQQASHWKDYLGLGIMDPTAAAGETLVLTQNDLTAMELLGWDVVPEPASMGMLVAGALLVFRRRRRKQAGPSQPA